MRSTNIAAQFSQHGENGNLAACRAEADQGCTTEPAPKKEVAETWRCPNRNRATRRTARCGRFGASGASAAPRADRVSGLTPGRASTAIREWPGASEHRSKKESALEA